jgi:5-aminopentanamidase
MPVRTLHVDPAISKGVFYMRVALVQTDPVFAAKEENLRQALSMMESVKADLYVLPELFDCGYNFAEVREVQSLADKFASGRTFSKISQFAREAKCFVVYGFAEAAGDCYYNSAAIVGRDGTEGLYRKIHLFDREKLFFQPGDLGFRVFKTEIGNIGLMICFDWYFPESARTLALRGAQLIAHPANLVLPNCPDGMRTRCLENRVFAITANRVGSENRSGHSLTFIGQSQITSPRGEILHRAPVAAPEIMVRDVDPVAADDKQLNSHNHLFGDRRPDTYECRTK